MQTTALETTEIGGKVDVGGKVTPAPSPGVPHPGDKPTNAVPDPDTPNTASWLSGYPVIVVVVGNLLLKMHVLKS